MLPWLIILLQEKQRAPSLPEGGGYSHILAIWVCEAGKGMVFKRFTLGQGLVITDYWSRIGSCLTDDST